MRIECACIVLAVAIASDATAQLTVIPGSYGWTSEVGQYREVKVNGSHVAGSPQSADITDSGAASGNYSTSTGWADVSANGGDDRSKGLVFTEVELQSYCLVSAKSVLTRLASAKTANYSAVGSGSGETSATIGQTLGTQYSNYRVKYQADIEALSPPSCLDTASLNGYITSSGSYLSLSYNDSTRVWSVGGQTRNANNTGYTTISDSFSAESLASRSYTFYVFASSGAQWFNATDTDGFELAICSPSGPVTCAGGSGIVAVKLTAVEVIQW